VPGFGKAPACLGEGFNNLTLKDRPLELKHELVIWLKRLKSMEGHIVEEFQKHILK
jgi:hypothetical protein